MRTSVGALLANVSSAFEMDPVSVGSQSIPKASIHFCHNIGASNIKVTNFLREENCGVRNEDCDPDRLSIGPCSHRAVESGELVRLITGRLLTPTRCLADVPLVEFFS